MCRLASAPFPAWSRLPVDSGRAWGPQRASANAVKECLCTPRGKQPYPGREGDGSKPQHLRCCPSKYPPGRPTESHGGWGDDLGMIRSSCAEKREGTAVDRYLPFGCSLRRRSFSVENLGVSLSDYRRGRIPCLVSSGGRVRGCKSCIRVVDAGLWWWVFVSFVSLGRGTEGHRV